MKKILILVALSLFLCSTASTFQDGGGKSTKNPKPTPKPRSKSAPKPRVNPHKAVRSSPLAKPPKTVKLTARDMQVIFQEMLPPQKQQEIAANPEEKKKFLDQIKKLLAVAQAAEEEGYSQRPEVKTQTDFQTDLHLNQAYRKKYPDMKVSDDQLNAYYQSHPSDFDNFLQSNPQFQRGAQREQFKKQFGEFKVIADLARKEKLDEDGMTKLAILLDRSQVLQNAYLNDFGKNTGGLISDQEVERYYNNHKADFDEVRVRHVLISSQPPDTSQPGQKDADKDKPKPLTKDEARQKAQAILNRARKGEDFAKLAKENSDDLGSKDRGGEYDFFPRGQMVPEFENAAFSLKLGEISDIVETLYGFHIIKLEGRRTAASPATEQKMRQRVTDKLKQEKIAARIAEIADKSLVVVPEDFDTTPKAGAQHQTPSPKPAGEAEQIERTGI